MGLELRGDGKTVPRILQRVGRADVTAAASGARPTTRCLALAPLQFLRQLPRLPAQELRCTRHVFLLAHARPRELIDSIENFLYLSIFAGSPDNRKNALPEFSPQLRYSGRCFPFECLSIQTPLARDDNIDNFHLRFEFDRFGYHIETGPNSRTAKTHQTEAKTAGSTCTGLLAIIDLEVPCNNVRESGKRAL